MKFSMDSSTRSVNSIDPEKASRLPFFHSFAGCETLSAFRGKGEKSGMVSTTFTKLNQCVTALDDAYLQSQEQFVVVMHDRFRTDTCE